MGPAHGFDQYLLGIRLIAESYAQPKESQAWLRIPGPFSLLENARPYSIPSDTSRGSLMLPFPGRSLSLS